MPEKSVERKASAVLPRREDQQRRRGWRVTQGASGFFIINQKMHNALQGGEINLSEMKKMVCEQTIYENVVGNHLGSHVMVAIHDPHR